MGADQQFYCGGDLTVSPNTEWEHSYRCAEGNAHGWLDMAGALNHSCNLYFIQVAEKMSAEFFYNYYQAFGLTRPLVTCRMRQRASPKPSRRWSRWKRTCTPPRSASPKS